MEQETCTSGISVNGAEAKEEAQKEIAIKDKEPVGSANGAKRGLEHGLHGRCTLRRSEGQGVQCDGRLQPRGARHGRRPELSGQKSGRDLGELGRGNRVAPDHTMRQWPRIHIQDLGAVVQKEKDRTKVHTTGQAYAERIYGKAQQVLQGRRT